MGRDVELPHGLQALVVVDGKTFSDGIDEPDVGDAERGVVGEFGHQLALLSSGERTSMAMSGASSGTL